MTENQRVRLIRKDKGLTLEKFGEQIGVQKSAVSKIERGDNALSEQLCRAICREYHVREEWLRNGEGDMYEPDEGQELRALAERYNVGSAALDLVRVVLSLDQSTQLDLLETLKAVLAESTAKADTDTAKDEKPLSEAQKAAEVYFIREYTTPAAAGFASPIEGEDYTLIPRDAKTPRNADFCVRIQGDSMEPYIKDGDRVFVQRDVTLEDMDVGIFYLDGDVYCKQICQDYVGNIYLLSANPLREKLNKKVDHNSTSTLVCLGKVITLGKLPEPRYKR